MLESLKLSNFTVFTGAAFTFGALNVIHGENGTGKTHLLKLLYAASAITAQPTTGDSRPAKTRIQRDLAEKLIGVFKPDRLGRLVRRPNGRHPALVSLHFDEPPADLEFRLGSAATAEVAVDAAPTAWRDAPPVYLPPRELLSLQPEYLGLAQERFLPFEEIWSDTSLLINRPLAKGVRSQPLDTLERAMGGVLLTDKAGRFYLKTDKEQIEMHLVAEGQRKLATVARLLANRGLREKSALFWDEPEANLNPRLIKAIAPVLLSLATDGMQVFVATHSLFLLREIHLACRKRSDLAVRHFGLHPADDGVRVLQGNRIEDAGSLAALDEDLAQSERYLDAETGAAK